MSSSIKFNSPSHQRVTHNDNGILDDLDDDKTQHNWELYKENAAPLERGRNANLLSKVLSSPTSESTQHKKDHDRNIRQYESLVRPSERFHKHYVRVEDERNLKLKSKYDDGPKKKRNGKYQSQKGEGEDKDSSTSKIDIDALLVKCKVDSDPIIHWLKYIKYHEETYPSDTHSQFLLMERCMHALFHIPKYANDERYIRVCILYAEKTSCPHDQFKIYHRSKIGEKVAIFWLAWAWIAEKKSDFPFADKLFRKAKQKNAKPMNIVDERYKQFQRRMSRHWLNNAEKQQQQQQQEEENGYYDENDHDSENDENRRGILNGLTEEGVRQNNRARGMNNHISSLGGVLSSRNGQQRGGPMNQNSNNNNSKSNKAVSSFSVFMDSNPDNNHVNGYDLNQSTLYQDENEENQRPLPRIVREKDRTKENMISAEAWNQRGGLVSQQTYHGGRDDDYDQGQEAAISSVARRWAGTGSESLVAGGTSSSSQPAFQVFVDEECIDKENNGTGQGGLSRTKRPASRSRNHDRTLRQRMDEGSLHKLREPLSIMRSSSDEGSDKSSKETKLIASSNKKGLSMRVTSSLKETKTSKDRCSSKHHSSSSRSTLSSRSSNPYEICFEERRAQRKYFKLNSSEHNFNLLERHEQCEVDCENSYDNEIYGEMDESSSIEEVDMEEGTQEVLSMLQNLQIDENVPPPSHDNRENLNSNLLNVTTFDEKKTALNTTTLHGTVTDSVAKRSNPRKVLFDVNNSIDSRSIVSAANNVSTASSVLNENDAVGIHDKEETVNTKFAARELSMMFASPGALNGSLNKSQLDTNCRKADSDRLLFSVHRNNEKGLNDSDESSKDEADNMLSIYCDAECDKVNDRGVFKIFEEVPVDTKDNESRKAIGLKTQYECSEDSDSDSSLRSEDRGSGDTASYSDIMALLKSANGDEISKKQNKDEPKKFGVFCDSQNDFQCEENKSLCCEIDDGTVLSENEAAFGDISFIPHRDNTIDIQGRVRQMKLT